MNYEKINLDRDKDPHTNTTCLRKIFELLRVSPGSIGSIARSLNMEKSTVSARLNELKNAGEIIYKGKPYSVELAKKDKDPISRKTVTFWRVSLPKRPTKARQGDMFQSQNQYA